MTVRLYVGNLPFELDDNGLREIVEPFGSVEEARVVTNARNKSRGFGFVTLETDQADEAMEALNDRVIEGRPLQVRPAHSMPGFQRAPRPFDSRRRPPRRQD